MAVSSVSIGARLVVLSQLILLVLLVVTIPSTTSFAIVVSPITRATRAVVPTTTTACHMFGGLKDAFKNDDSLGPQQNAGLKNGPNYNEQVTVNGKSVPGAVVGQKLTVVASKVRVKIPVNCQKGDCGTCMVSLNGRKVKGTYRFVKASARRTSKVHPLTYASATATACQTSLPSGKATIQTL